MKKICLDNFWQRLRAFTKDRGVPTFVTWNGLSFTFPFLIERSTALGVEPSCILPRARFQPWKHLDLFAELAAYDPHRYMSLQSRLSLWRLSLNGNGSGCHFGDHDLLDRQWRKGNPKPLEENLTLILEAIQRILNRVAPCFLEARNTATESMLPVATSLRIIKDPVGHLYDCRRQCFDPFPCQLAYEFYYSRWSCSHVRFRSPLPLETFQLSRRSLHRCSSTETYFTCLGIWFFSWSSEGEWKISWRE